MLPAKGILAAFAAISSVTSAIFLGFQSAPASVPNALANPPAHILSINASSTPREVADYIVWRGDALGLPDSEIDLALSIAYAESHFRCVPNKDGPRYGICTYQFVLTTWQTVCLDMDKPPEKRKALVEEGSDVWDPEQNVECGLKLVADGEFGHWAPYSIGVWQTLPVKKSMLDAIDWSKI